MVEKRIVLQNESGLHMRPGRLVVQEAKKYACDITVEKEDGRSANLKSLVKILKIGISKGETIVLRCDGEDEQSAALELEAVIANLNE